MTDTTARQMIELPISADGMTHTYYLGTMTRAQADAFVAIPGPGDFYVCHRDENIKDRKCSKFTLLLADAAGKLRPVTIAPDGTRVR